MPKRLVKRALVNSNVMQLAARMTQPRAVVLMYHSVVEDPRQTANTIRISQSRESFEWQMRALAERFNPITLDQVVDFAQQRSDLPRRSVAVTFDDGFADNYEFVLPILAKYGIRATFYIMVNAVATGEPPWYCRLTYAFSTTKRHELTFGEPAIAYNLNKPEERMAALHTCWDSGSALTGDAQRQMVECVEQSLEVHPLDASSKLMLNWDQVRAMHKAGHTIGGHTMSHPNLAHVPLDQARSEIMGCKETLEGVLGVPLVHFAYPHPALNPQWSSETLAITRDGGFKSAVLTTQGAVFRGDDPLCMMRVPADERGYQWSWDVERAFLRNRA